MQPAHGAAWRGRCAHFARRLGLPHAPEPARSLPTDRPGRQATHTPTDRLANTARPRRSPAGPASRRLSGGRPSVLRGLTRRGAARQGASARRPPRHRPTPPTVARPRSPVCPSGSATELAARSEAPRRGPPAPRAAAPSPEARLFSKPDEAPSVSHAKGGRGGRPAASSCRAAGRRVRWRRGASEEESLPG